MSARLNAVYVDHRRSLLGRAMRIVRDPQVAEDLIQETYLRARGAADKGPIANIGAFLHRTVQNLALDHLRRRRTRARFEVDACADADPLLVVCGAPTAEERLLQRERVARFKDALDGLPERARRVWLLSRVEGWSYPRIAEHLGVSQGTVFNDMKLAMGHMVDALARAERG